MTISFFVSNIELRCSCHSSKVSKCATQARIGHDCRDIVHVARANVRIVRNEHTIYVAQRTAC